MKKKKEKILFVLLIILIILLIIITIIKLIPSKKTLEELLIDDGYKLDDTINIGDRIVEGLNAPNKMLIYKKNKSQINITIYNNYEESKNSIMETFNLLKETTNDYILKEEKKYTYTSGYYKENNEYDYILSYDIYEIYCIATTSKDDINKLMNKIIKNIP